MNGKGIITFLKTKKSKKELKIALSILTEFKGCESLDEWACVPFMAWGKVEQLEEFLQHLVNGKELEDDTKEQLEEGKT